MSLELFVFSLGFVVVFFLLFIFSIGVAPRLLFREPLMFIKELRYEIGGMCRRG